MLAALSLVFLTAVQQGPMATVYGQVRSDAMSLPLSGASIQVISAGISSHATTDSFGVYRLRNVPIGRRLLRATHIDHAPLEVEIVVSDRTELVLDFALELRPVKLPPITARAIAFKAAGDTLAADAGALGQANVRALEGSPGVAEIGLAEMTREVPGPEPPDPSDVLYVRGGTTDLKLVLLNGAPVFAPFHLGGLINPLDGDLMRAARLYVGGAPARYDGGLSYVMDLETRAGRSNQSRASVAVDLLSTRTVLEGPLTNKSTYLLGARSVHGIGARAFVGPSFPYAYADGIARIDFAALGGDLTLAGFWNHEAVQLDSVAGGRAKASWGNTSGSIRYRNTIGGADAELTVAAGRFHTQLPVGIVRPIVTDGVADRLRASMHFTNNYGPINLQFGGSFDQQSYGYLAWPRFATRDSLLLRAAADGAILGLYVDGQWQPFKRLTLRTGLRSDLFAYDDAPRIAPRLAATFMLTDKAALTIAGGRYRQYVRAGTGNGVIGTPVADSTPGPTLAIAKASHLVIGLDQDLGDGVRVAVEGYYKAFEGLPASQGGDLTEASGLDLWVRRGTGSYTGWLGYSLAWIWSIDHGAGAGTEIFAGRQLLSAGASGPLGASGKFDLRVAYGAGLPFTAIPEPEAAPPVFTALLKPKTAIGTVPDDNFTYPSPPDEQYLRVDAQVARTFVTDWRGFAFELTPYFKVLNALDRRDALFYHFDRSQQEPQARAVAALPVLPIVGLEWRF
ncbi:MAG: carboxypeptidase regulatory-like domain-containing protein [Gemmatimonadota bacterium]